MTPECKKVLGKIKEIQIKSIEIQKRNLNKALEGDKVAFEGLIFLYEQLVDGVQKIIDEEH